MRGRHHAAHAAPRGPLLLRLILWLLRLLSCVALSKSDVATACVARRKGKSGRTSCRNEARDGRAPGLCDRWAGQVGDRTDREARDLEPAREAAAREPGPVPRARRGDRGVPREREEPDP